MSVQFSVPPPPPLSATRVWLGATQRLVIKDNADEVAEWVAAYVVARINGFKPTPERPFVLGLPTGSSPLTAYKKVGARARASSMTGCFSWCVCVCVVHQQNGWCVLCGVRCCGVGLAGEGPVTNCVGVGIAFRCGCGQGVARPVCCCCVLPPPACCRIVYVFMLVGRLCACAAQLIALHKAGQVSFKHVVTFK